MAAWHAQTGFLTSGIQAGAAGLLRDRPFRAGLCIGALIIKPHLAILFPVALLAGRQWRAIAGAAVSVTTLLLLAWAVFGTATMLAYPRSWAVSDYLLTTGSDTFFLRQTTIYAMLRLAFSADTAMAVQAIGSLAMVALIWLGWARPGPLDGKLALLFAATPLATPYLFSYDLPFLIAPVCWLISRWPRDALMGWGRPVLLFFYLSPLLTRAMALPIGINPMPLLLLGLVWLVWRSLTGEQIRPAPAAGM